MACRMCIQVDPGWPDATLRRCTLGLPTQPTHLGVAFHGFVTDANLEERTSQKFCYIWHVDCLDYATSLKQSIRF
eukprot:1243783-Amphidinium_carterae.1